jgi:gamma-tubulin complex component 4
LQAFSQAITHIKNMPSLNKTLFGKVIEEIRQCVANRLWHFVVIQQNCIADLTAAKDYFLLGKGEFFQTFIEESRSLMLLSPQSTAEYDLNAGPLQQTTLKLQLEDDKFLKQFKFALRSYSFSYKNFNNLDGLILVGDVDLSKHTNAFKITSSRNHLKSGALWHSLK